jgi:replicative DNA helicase
LNGQVPPHDLEAEQAVLSACIMAPDGFDLAQGIVLPEHCYSPGNRRILEAVYDLKANGRQLDAVSIRGWLKSHGRLEEVGGAAAILEAIQVSPAIVNVRQHAETVRDKARLRQLIQTCNRVAAEGYGDCGDIQQFIDGAEHQIFEISRLDASVDVVPLATATGEAVKTIAAASATDSRGVTGVRSGFVEIDRLTTGMHNGELFIVAGRPGMGKTSFVLNAAVNIAREHRGRENDEWIPSEYGAVFFSLEMPREQLAYRLIASESFTDVSRLRSGNVHGEDWTRLTEAAGRLGRMPIWIDDTPAISLLEVRSKVRRLQASLERGDGPTKKLGMVAVDYLQLMRGPRSAGNREQEISALSRGLKQLAKEAGVPVMALSQLNRSVEIRSAKDKRPQLSDLRESGAIEQDADTILFLYRDEYYFKDQSVDRGIAEIIIAKQRNGPTATVKTRFTDSFTRFDNLAREDRFDDQPDDGFNDLDAGDEWWDDK